MLVLTTVKARSQRAFFARLGVGERASLRSSRAGFAVAGRGLWKLFFNILGARRLAAWRGETLLMMLASAFRCMPLFCLQDSGLCCVKLLHGVLCLLILHCCLKKLCSAMLGFRFCTAPPLNLSGWTGGLSSGVRLRTCMTPTDAWSRIRISK